jgi:hypothetical protein
LRIHNGTMIINVALFRVLRILRILKLLRIFRVLRILRDVIAENANCDISSSGKYEV